MLTWPLSVYNVRALAVFVGMEILVILKEPPYCSGCTMWTQVWPECALNHDSGVINVTQFVCEIGSPKGNSEAAFCRPQNTHHGRYATPCCRSYSRHDYRGCLKGQQTSLYRRSVGRTDLPHRENTAATCEWQEGTLGTVKVSVCFFFALLFTANNGITLFYLFQ